MKKERIIIFLLSTVTLLFCSYRLLFCNDLTVNIIAGKETGIYLNTITKTIELSQDEAVISVNGDLKREYSVDTKKNLTFLSKKEGIFQMTVNILGVIPSGKITVNVIPESKVYVGGDAVGIRLKTKGVIAVGFEEIETVGNGALCPAKEAGIEEGDVITEIDGCAINTAEEFRNLLKEAGGEDIFLTLVRKGNDHIIAVTPVKNADGKYFVGLWVRDNIAGIGTLTCVSADMKRYAALGHSIADTTTGIQVPVNEGELINAKVISVTKSRKNVPGEIKAVIDPNETVVGNVESNNSYGVYGDYYADISEKNTLCEFATQDEICLGPAVLVATVDGTKTQYEIEIVKITRQNARDSKSMVIKITDERLLEKTGGIIQGMSGSPIIQNSKIIGAVTHVMLNDPTTGYAIFIEWMIKDMYSRHFSTNFSNSV